MTAEPFDFLSLWALTLVTVAVGFLSAEAGYQLGRLRRRLHPEAESSVGIMGAAMLSTLGFMLAFTVAMASTHVDAREQFVLDQANAIRTAYLRAAFFPDPQRSTIRGILRGYLDAELRDPEVGKVEPDQRVHARLWSEATAAMATQPDSTLATKTIESLNAVINLSAQRVQAALTTRIPRLIWTTLYFVGVLSMAGIGYHEGLTSVCRSPALMVLVLTFSAFVYLIAELDRPGQGRFHVSQQALVDVRDFLDEMEAGTPGQATTGEGTSR